MRNGGQMIQPKVRQENMDWIPSGTKDLEFPSTRYECINEFKKMLLQ